MKPCERFSQVVCLLLAAGVASATGCGEANVGPQTHPVTGIVTMDDKPVAGASVQFTPLDGAIGALATTTAEGRFDVSILLDMGKNTQRGLPQGEYAISITKLEAPNAAAPPKNVLPQKYADPKSSGFKERVAAGVDNDFEFRLNP